MKLVQLKGKTYAVDLWWQVRAGGSASHKIMLTAARETAQELKAGFDCVALRSQQYGLGITPGGVRQPSLAAALRPQVRMGQGFLGIFRLSEGWWVCGMSHGAIAAAGDRLFEDESAARAHIRQLRDLFGASDEVVYGTTKESEQALLPLLADDARVELLFPDPERWKPWLQIGAVTLALLLIGVGLKQFWDSWVQESAVRSTRQLLQGKEAQRREILADPGRHFKKNWLAAPRVANQSALCLPVLMTVPLALDGWALESALCTPSALSTDWKHRPGAAYTRLPRFMNADARLETPQKAVSRKKLTSIAPRNRDASLLSRADITARLYEITRQTGCRLKLGWSAPEKITVEEVEVTAPWVHGTWHFEAVPAAMVLSDNISGLLDAVPGLILTEVRLEFEGRPHWKMKGDVYASLH